MNRVLEAREKLDLAVAELLRTALCMREDGDDRE